MSPPTASSVVNPPLTLHMPPSVRMSVDEFYQFCQANPELRVELSAEGEIIIMSPAGGETSSRNSRITQQLSLWATQNRSGIAFDSSGGFTLPNGAVRSPDASWVRRDRLSALTAAEKRRFLPLCPDFVIELRSPTDRLSDLQVKMQEYVENGALLGWLIDPETRIVHIYRPGAAPLRQTEPADLSAEPELPGFTLDLETIWDPGF